MVILKFDRSNPNWMDLDHHNDLFLRNQETIANSLRRAHGYLLLNEVLRLLGFEETEEGALVGWFNKDVSFGAVTEPDGTITLNLDTNSDNVFRDKQQGEH